MTYIDDGGPAFPTHPAFSTDRYGEDYKQFEGRDFGMSLRDWFAVHAPMPLDAQIEIEMRRDRMANPHNYPNKPKRRNRIEIIADLNYEYADAMIAARKPKGN